MATAEQPTITAITSCAVPGRDKTFVNVYGLSSKGQVWQWNAKVGRWEPHKIPEKNAPGSVVGAPLSDAMTRRTSLYTGD